MISDLLSRLTADRPQTLPDPDARLALTALLVRVARTDGDYAAEEVRRIDKISEKRFGLDHADARALREQAETLEAEAPDTVRFTRAIKDAIGYDERSAVVEALWEVALADGMRDEEEDALLRLVANLLGIGDADSHRLRLKVQAKLG